MTLLVGSARRRQPAIIEVPPYEIPTTAPYNAPAFIHLPTYDGSNQTVHPDVIDFAHVLPEGTWRGHRFWMAHTPYPFSNDTYENPSILVSSGGITWTEPAGLTNPIVTAPATGYNADTELIYDFETDQLACMFLRTNEGVRLTRSSDGVNWSAHAQVDYTNWSGVSPSVLWDSTVQLWRMWHNGGLVTLTAEALEGPWIPGPSASGQPSPIWHSNVQHAPGGGFHLLVHTQVGANGVLKAASSADGITWTTNPTALVTPGPAEWSMDGLYRPAFTLHEDGDRYRVWYSGQSAFGVWRIGYTEIPLTEWPAIP